MISSAISLSSILIVLSLQSTITAPPNPPKNKPNPDCYSVVNAWNSMNEAAQILFDNAIPNGCCGKLGVTCRGNAVTMLQWNSSSLSGSISPYLGNLTKLEKL